MPAALTFPGLDAEIRRLQALPRLMTEEATVIARKTADTAAARITAQYQRVAKTGNLARQVSVRPLGGGRGKVSMDVRSGAFHGWLYEHGTKVRRTKKGWMRGQMRPADVFIPEMVRYRRLFYQDVARMMRQYGLEVTGDA